jgi:hypothetical protein
MGTPAHRRDHPPAGLRSRLTSPNHPCDQKGQPRARGTPPTRRDSRETRLGQTLKTATRRRLNRAHQDHETLRLVPAVLAVIGLALLLAGFFAYPRRAESAAPISGYVVVSGIGLARNYVNSHIQTVYYTVDQLHPDIARLTVRLLLSGDSVPHGAQVRIHIRDGPGLVPGVPAVGVPITHCSPSPCHVNQPFPNEALSAPHFASDGTATAYFFVKAQSFGVAVNGVTAAAAFPALFTPGTRPATLVLTYQIPSASSYDWSSYPPTGLDNSRAVWAEPLTAQQMPVAGLGGTLARVATGINHAAETHDSTLTLLAGVLFGLGGGALVAAVQEALHD